MNKFLKNILLAVLVFCLVFSGFAGCFTVSDPDDGNNDNTHQTDDDDNDDDDDDDNNDDDDDDDDDGGTGVSPVTEDSVVVKQTGYLPTEVVDVPLTNAFSWQENTFTREFLDFFDIENKVTINIIISSDELKKIDQDYIAYGEFDSKSPIYRMCDVEIETPYMSYTYYQVGVRMKGNTSRRSFWNYNSNEVDDMIHYKLSFQEKFTKKAYYGNSAMDWSGLDEELEQRENRTFLGLSKLDLKWNKNLDRTHIREIYTNMLFEEQGVLAPKITASNVNLEIDGEGYNFGVFSAYEPVDASFFERRLVDSACGGDLYKSNYTKMGPASYTIDSISGNKVGEENEDENYFPPYDIKTNKKTTDHSTLKTLVNTIGSMGSGNVSANVETFNSLIDMEYFARFEAMSYFVGNPDDLRNNYNNHYTYFLKDSGKMIIIPYDYDRTLGINMDWNPTGSACVYVEPYANTVAANGSHQQNPIYNKAFVLGAEGYTGTVFLDMYKAELQKVLTNPLVDTQEFASVFEVVRANYGLLSVPNYPNGGVIGVQFSNDRQSDGSGTHQNLDVATYMERKLQTLRNGINY